MRLGCPLFDENNLGFVIGALEEVVTLASWFEDGVATHRSASFKGLLDFIGQESGLSS
jgi:hypothetical protein